MDEKELIDEFHRLWYSKGQFQMNVGTEEDTVLVQLDVKYRGIATQKNPLDLWIYHEILWDKRPDVVLEFGTAAGGTTLFIADQLNLIGNGEIISVDVVGSADALPQHPRITYMLDATENPALKKSLSFYLDRLNRAPWNIDRKQVMLILDDNHETQHVLMELEMYNEFVTPGQYLIVEDTNVDAPLNFGNGPGRAVKFFLEEHPEFVADKTKEKFLMTWNPGGYLLRR